MKIVVAGLGLTLLAGPAAEAGATAPPVIVHGPAAVAKSILDAEGAFEARSVSAGTAQAMREFMDPVDGLSFNGGDPARGAEAIFNAHGGNKPGGKLTWTPAEVFADTAGDMGATWGHFRFVPPVAGAKPVTGRYVTVWRKQNGQWKGIIDIGNPD